MAEAPDNPLFWLSDSLAEELELPALADADADALAEPDADALALDSEDALAEAVADADALAELLWLSAGALALELQAARPKVAARLRDRTAIDFFTADFSFRHTSLCNGAVRSVVGVQAGMSPVYALMLAPRPENSLGCRAAGGPLPRYSHSPLWFKLSRTQRRPARITVGYARGVF